MQLDVEAAVAAWLHKTHDNTTPPTKDDESIANSGNRQALCRDVKIDVSCAITAGLLCETTPR